ncbi:cyanophycin synthetase [Legionella hackeliae]|uniref:Cyanophycin synthetase n=1 Tax=Legionella hackeliae TaxID=449 RepID=A0A0A8UX01_LEGHA|nr:cyanophycin synthetase [Legionella hackeliae]KTD12645.1 cyanophycin synthetase [Legionella hackeliae]CEK12061.1 Cyanophycin synthetase [Legionella hackeliae]STX48849.1 cyanophycin synthetase [Legionella hackeliae]
MKILKLDILKGPNYWSNNRKKLIVMKLALEKYEYLPTNLLPGFRERLKTLIPSLYNHRCSPGVEGGFFERVTEGTWLGHVVEHIALELQWLAGMQCGFGRTYSAHEEGVYNVIFSYEIEAAGLYAAEAAVNIARTLAEEKEYLLLEKNLQALNQIVIQAQLGPSTQAILTEAERRNIPYFQYDNNSLVILGYGQNQKKIWATISSQTSSIGVDIAANKELTKQVLASNFIPIPFGCTIRQEDELNAALEHIKFPVAIKPLNGNHGRGVTVDINNHEKAILAFNLAKETANEVIVERYIQGEDYRFLVVNYKVVAVAKRTPAMVIGDGEHTIEQLIDEVNRDPRRGMGHENFLTAIKIDESTLAILKEKQLSLDSVLADKQILYLKEAANISSGGTATDVTEEVHPSTNYLMERVARLMDLDICGVDVIAKDIHSELTEENGAIIEVNAGPGLRMHLAPTYGKPRNVAEPILNMLFPADSQAGIPLVAVTGTNGKTTVVRLIAHLAKQARYYTGYTTTEGVYIDNKLIYEGDCSGPASARVVLQDPKVNFAVLECARGGILRAGLGFNESTISIITNITSDHLGLNDIQTLEELTRVKSVVAHSTKKGGYAILNADDRLVYGLKDELNCHIALFSRYENPLIQEHCTAGGLAAYLENDVIVINDGTKKHALARVSELPLTLEGTATCMIQNILPAVLAGFVSKFSLELMQNALFTFYPTVENIPGRMNLFDFADYQVMVDYAHNEGAFVELQKYLSTIQCEKKIGIITAPGDRRNEDITKLGYHSAYMFDEIIIRHDQDGRGRTKEEMTELLKKGINESKLNPLVTIVSDELEAICYAMREATPNSFIYFSVENVFRVVNFMKKVELNFKLRREEVVV